MRLLNMHDMNPKNRELTIKFLEFLESSQEIKSNNTLMYYVQYFITMDRWYNHKAWDEPKDEDYKELIKRLKKEKPKKAIARKFKDGTIKYKVIDEEISDSTIKNTFVRHKRFLK